MCARARCVCVWGAALTHTDLSILGDTMSRERRMNGFKAHQPKKIPESGQGVNIQCSNVPIIMTKTHIIGSLIIEPID